METIFIMMIQIVMAFIAFCFFALIIAAPVTLLIGWWREHISKTPLGPYELENYYDEYEDRPKAVRKANYRQLPRDPDDSGRRWYTSYGDSDR